MNLLILIPSILACLAFLAILIVLFWPEKVEKKEEDEGKSIVGTSQVIIKGKVYKYIFVGDMRRFYGAYILVSVIYWFATSHGWVGMSQLIFGSVHYLMLLGFSALIFELCINKKAIYFIYNQADLGLILLLQFAFLLLRPSDCGVVSGSYTYYYFLWSKVIEKNLLEVCQAGTPFGDSYYIIFIVYMVCNFVFLISGLNRSIRHREDYFVGF